MSGGGAPPRIRVPDLIGMLFKELCSPSQMYLSTHKSEEREGEDYLPPLLMGEE